jgi:uncharacterized protein (DUF1330 family)
MSQQELLKRVTRVLHELGVKYMVSGSLVSSLQGEPRATHDIDIVVAIKRPDAKELPKAFPPPEYYLSEDSIVNALETNGMFNLIAVEAGDKVDFWVLTDQPFDTSRFSRRYVEKVMGMEIAVSRPEDTILMKLSWADKCGGSEKHFTDALRVYEVQYGQLDMGYLEEWANRLDIGPLYKKLQEEAEAI